MVEKEKVTDTIFKGRRKEAHAEIAEYAKDWAQLSNTAHSNRI